MRLADFCNPHFKDEHPNSAWFPACKTLEIRAIHFTRTASPGSLPQRLQLFTAADARAPKL